MQKVYIACTHFEGYSFRVCVCVSVIDIFVGYDNNVLLRLFSLGYAPVSIRL